LNKNYEKYLEGQIPTFFYSYIQSRQILTPNLWDRRIGAQP